MAQGAKLKTKVQVLQSELQKALRSKEEFRNEIKELEVTFIYLRERRNTKERKSHLLFRGLFEQFTRKR